MKGIVRTAALALCCLAGAGGVGCVTYQDLVDPCYPQRYNAAARKEVQEAIAPQEANGHVLDQTIWNYDFEAGAATLTGGGLEHLAYMARRRPRPDPVVYLQTAQDIAFDPANPGEMANRRQDLDARRVAAIENFLNAETAGRRGEFQVLVHDPSGVGAPGAYGAAEFIQIIRRPVGGLPSAAGGAPAAGPIAP